MRAQCCFASVSISQLRAARRRCESLALRSWCPQTCWAVHSTGDSWMVFQMAWRRSRFFWLRLGKKSTAPGLRAPALSQATRTEPWAIRWCWHRELTSVTKPWNCDSGNCELRNCDSVRLSTSWETAMTWNHEAASCEPWNCDAVNCELRQSCDPLKLSNSQETAMPWNCEVANCELRTCDSGNCEP